MPIYMQIDNISGAVTAQDYKNWIELNSVNFGASRPIATKPGNVMDRESSKPNIKEVAIKKNLDSTTASLFSETCAGIGKTVKIDFCNTGNSPYLELTLSNTLISSHNIESQNKGPEIEHIESLTLNFDKIEVRYTPYDEKNNMGSPMSTGYDLSTGIKI
ncbi:MAG: type VI secretion system tube protein Hcp [Proteobacteria bacterium]|nr:type VI secretion system tube protein Hcp [Pseudomonadota bacterium]